MPISLVDNGDDQGRNRHPVDQLADVRHQIADLKKQEDELRRQIIDGECSATGDEFVAKVTKHQQDRIDADALKKEFGMAKLRPFMRQTEYDMVKLRPR